jgi:hypothetical protein
MKQVIIFSLGAAIGGFVGYVMTKRYYETFIDDEIESVKEAYSEYDKKSEERYQRAKEAMKEYGVPGGNYSNVERLDLEEKPEEVDEEPVPFPEERSDIPYVISPDSFHDEFVDVLDKETLTYFAGSDTLVTDEDEVLEIEDIIGRDALEHFGEYESDTVFVRNERLGADYEVVYTEGVYSD